MSLIFAIPGALLFVLGLVVVVSIELSDRPVQSIPAMVAVLTGACLMVGNQVTLVLIQVRRLRSDLQQQRQ